MTHPARLSTSDRNALAKATRAAGRDMAFHRRICEWLTANGIPHEDVPIDAVPTIVDGRVSVVTCARRNGRFYVVDDKLVTTTATVPLKTQPPPDFADWLAGRVDAFGRTR